MSGYGNQRLRQQRRATIFKWLLLLVLFASATAAGYWYFNPQQRPAWLAEHLPTAATAKVTLYRWKDDSGQWVVTDHAPSDRKYETLEYRHDSNVMPFDPAQKDNE